ncbi:MAG: hypothetical protein NTV70_16690 [Acidobacteria bacterium]|nr:hypothetical protein [Acidobacteriota bacterium]
MRALHPNAGIGNMKYYVTGHPTHSNRQTTASNYRPPGFASPPGPMVK